MAIIVEGPGGVEVEFPDGTPHDVIDGAMRQHFGGGSKPTPPVAAAPPARAPETSYFENSYHPPTLQRRGMRQKPTLPESAYTQPAPLAGIGEEALNSALMNWGDEATSALRAPFSDRDYADILKETRARRAKFAEDYPEQSRGADIAGAVGTSVLGGGAALRLAGAAPSLFRLALAEAGMSGLLGATDETGKLEGEHSPADYIRTGAEGAGVPATIGAAVPIAGRAVGAVAGPWASQAAQYLADRGVRLTPGELIGGPVRRLEDAAGSVPVIGDMIRSRRREGIDTFNRAAWDEALRPAGLSIPDDVAMGHEAVAEARNLFRHEYPRVVSQLEAQNDTPFLREMVNIRRSLPASIRPQFMDAYRRHVVRNVENGQLTGTGIQDTLQGLRKEATRLRRSPGNAYDIDLADALMDVRGAIERSVERYSRSADLEDYLALNNSYGRFASLRDAASRLGTETGIAADTPGAGGVFRPAQLLNAIRTADQSVGRGSFAAGEAPMQGFARTGKNVMGQELPSSGTSERLMMLSALGLTGATAPLSVTAGGLGALGTIAALYSRPGNRAFQAMATYSPHTRALLRRAIERASAAGAPAAAEIMGE